MRKRPCCKQCHPTSLAQTPRAWQRFLCAKAHSNLIHRQPLIPERKSLPGVRINVCPGAASGGKLECGPWCIRSYAGLRRRSHSPAAESAAIPSRGRPGEVEGDARGDRGDRGDTQIRGGSVCASREQADGANGCHVLYTHTRHVVAEGR